MERKMMQLQEHNQSKENAERVEPFIQMEKKYIILAKQYAGSCRELYSKVLQEEYRREYAKGGRAIHRGFYSPSSLDVITRGCHRGRLLKRLAQNGNYDYEYIFDERGDMICCKHHGSVEILIYKENYVLGLEFDHSGDCMLERISECWYKDSKLVKYVSALLPCCNEGKACTEISTEIFGYANNVLQKVNWYRYSPAVKLLTHEEINLYRDAIGNLLEYAVREVDLPAYKEKDAFLEQRYRAKKNVKLFHDAHRFNSAGDGSPSTGDGSVCSTGK